MCLRCVILSSERKSGNDSGGGGEASDGGRRTGDGSSQVDSAVIDRHYDSVISIAASKGSVTLEPVSELLELSFADRLDLLHHRPLKALSAGRSGERAIVAPVLGHIHPGEEVTDFNLRGFRRALGSDTIEEGVKEGVIEVTTILNIEENSNDGAGHLVLWYDGADVVATANHVHEMHLEVVARAVDSVLGRGVEVEIVRLEV